MYTKEHSSKATERFCNQLRKNGLKATSQRIAVHSAMTELVHASAEMVFEHIIGNSTVKITTSSVYNILAQLSDLGIYQRRLSADNKMYFDIHTEPHFHIYDYVNRTYKDKFDDELYENIMKVIGTRRFRGYTIENIDIEFVVKPKRKK